MTEEMAQLEVRLQKALEQQKESMVKNNHKYRVIRGEPERAPNTRVTYGEFAVPMYVCMYLCM